MRIVRIISWLIALAIFVWLCYLYATYLPRVPSIWDS